MTDLCVLSKKCFQHSVHKFEIKTHPYTLEKVCQMFRFAGTWHVALHWGSILGYIETHKLHQNSPSHQACRFHVHLTRSEEDYSPCILEGYRYLWGEISFKIYKRVTRLLWLLWNKTNRCLRLTNSRVGQSMWITGFIFVPQRI